MDTIRAVVVDPTASERLVIREVSYPVALSSEAIVRVKTLSLNRGDVHNTFPTMAGGRPGWDFAGVVEQQANDGSGSCVGTRVVGVLSSGSWAEGK